MLIPVQSASPLAFGVYVIEPLNVLPERLPSKVYWQPPTAAGTEPMMSASMWFPWKSR